MRSTLTPDQQKTVQHGIGGSNIPNILGVGYETPLQEYEKLINPENRPDLSENPQVRAGIYLEPVIRRMATDVFGMKIRECKITKTHASHRFFRANIDGKIEGRDEGVEIKNRGHFQGNKYGEQGTDAVLDSELVQCLWYLMMTGWKRWHLVVLIGGFDLRRFVVERDEELIEHITERAVNFWEQHVVPRVPPPPSTLDDAARLWPQDDGTEIVATPEVGELIDQLKDMKKLIKDSTSLATSIELALKEYMGSATSVVTPDGKRLATWKSQSSSRIDTKALRAELPDIAEQFTRSSESRVLRLK